MTDEDGETLMETPISEVPAGYVCFFRFAAGEFEYEELFYCAARLAKADGRTHDDVEAEFKQKLRYVRNAENRNHPFETWGPQELADRLNAVKDVGVD
jgi:hypothetical protein